MSGRRALLRSAGLGLLASLIPKALKALPRGKAGSGGGGGSSPATIRVIVSGTNYDLALSTKINADSYVNSTYSINQLLYDIPLTGPLAAALPGLVVKWRPDSSGSRYEVVFEMSNALGPTVTNLPAYSAELLDGTDTVIPMVYSPLNTVPSGGTPNVGVHIVYGRWRMVSAARPVVLTPANLASMRATPTYASLGAPTTTNFNVLDYVPMSPQYNPGGTLGIRYDGGTGGRFELSLFPEYYSQYLALQDSDSFRAMMIAAEAVCILGMMVRDSNGQIFNMDNFPDYSAPGGSGSHFWAPYDVSAGSIPPDWSITHWGSFSYVPYMLTGDLFFLENLQATINTALQQQNSGFSSGEIALLGTEFRGVAWQLRELACAAYATPTTGLPASLLPQSYFLSKLKNTLQYQEDAYINGLYQETHNFNLSYLGGDPYALSGGFESCYFGQVLALIVWMGFTDWQTQLDWDAGFQYATGNGLSGWGYNQPGASYGAFYHTRWVNLDASACANHKAAWDTAASSVIASFTASISGTTLTLTPGTLTGGFLAGQESMTVLGASIPPPVFQVSSGIGIVSGSGNTWTLDTNLGTITSEAMQAVIAVAAGPWFIDSVPDRNFVWQGPLTPNEFISAYSNNWTTPLSAMPTFIPGGGGGYQPLYAAVVRAYAVMATGGSAMFSSIASNTLYSTGQYASYSTSYNYTTGTPPTIPSATTDALYVPPKYDVGAGNTFAYFNGSGPTQITVETGSLLLLANFGSNNTGFFPVSADHLKLSTGSGNIIVQGTAGHIQLDDGYIWDMATNNQLPPNSFVRLPGSLGQPGLGDIWTLPAYFISPSGNDSTGNGTVGNPWLTPGKAQTAMQGAGNKITWLRGGTYSIGTGLTLTSADSGTQYQAYPGEVPVLDGGSSTAICFTINGGAANITLNWLTIQHFTQSGIDGMGAGNRVTNCTVQNITAANTGQGCIRFDFTIGNLYIANNLCQNCTGPGIVISVGAADPGVSGTITITQNKVLNVNTSLTDTGAIYILDRSHTMAANPIPHQITNNYIKNYGARNLTGGQQAVGIYLDDNTSNCLVQANVICGTGTYGIQYHGGDHNIVQNNIIDLTAGYKIALYEDQPSFVIGGGHMAGNTFTNNIVYSTVSPPSTMWDYIDTSVTIALPTVTTNQYYDSVSPFPNTGTIVDASPTVGDPLFANASTNNYTLDPLTSPAIGAPVFFVPGSWIYGPR